MKHYTVYCIDAKDISATITVIYSIYAKQGNNEVSSHVFSGRLRTFTLGSVGFILSARLGARKIIEI